MSIVPNAGLRQKLTMIKELGNVNIVDMGNTSKNLFGKSRSKTIDHNSVNV